MDEIKVRATALRMKEDIKALEARLNTLLEALGAADRPDRRSSFTLILEKEARAVWALWKAGSSEADIAHQLDLSTTQVSYLRRCAALLTGEGKELTYENLTAAFQVLPLQGVKDFLKTLHERQRKQGHVPMQLGISWDMFSRPVAKILQRMRITERWQLSMCKGSELLAQKGFGHRSLKEVVDYLKKHDSKLYPEDKE